MLVVTTVTSWSPASRETSSASLPAGQDPASLDLRLLGRLLDLAVPLEDQLLREAVARWAPRLHEIEGQAVRAAAPGPSRRCRPVGWPAPSPGSRPFSTSPATRPCGRKAWSRTSSTSQNRAVTSEAGALRVLAARTARLARRGALAAAAPAAGRCGRRRPPDSSCSCTTFDSVR